MIICNTLYWFISVRRQSKVRNKVTVTVIRDSDTNKILLSFILIHFTFFRKIFWQNFLTKLFDKIVWQNLLTKFVGKMFDKIFWYNFWQTFLIKVFDNIFDKMFWQNLLTKFVDKIVWQTLTVKNTTSSRQRYKMNFSFCSEYPAITIKFVFPRE